MAYDITIRTRLRNAIKELRDLRWLAPHEAGKPWIRAFIQTNWPYRSR
jgi:hypothetical protein